MLRRFVEDGSQEAFGQLVQRHLNFVYSVCRRETGDHALAEDTTQAVFLILARKASSIREGTPVTGWLFKTSRFAARNAMRQENRRQASEREVIAEMTHRATQEETWNSIEPLLHDGIAALKGKDRDAILLRYFEGRSLKEVGHLLGLSENTARMRVERAIEKLKLYLKRHGVMVTVAVLAPLLTERAVLAAPASCVSAVTILVANVTGAGIGAAGVGLIGSEAAAIYKGVLKMMFLNNVKVAAVVVGLSVAGTGGGVLALHSSYATGSAISDTGSQQQPDKATQVQAQSCQDNLKILTTGLLSLTQDYGKLTLHGSSFKQAVLVYVKSLTPFVCPDDGRFLKPGAGGLELSDPNNDAAVSYSFNTNLEGTSLARIARPVKTVLIYEGKDGVLDYRHDGQAGVAFVDGHVALVGAEDAKSLVWLASGNATAKQARSGAAQANTDRLKQVGLAELQWLDDNNERYTITTESWLKELKPYAKDDSIFYIDGEKQQPFSFNGNLTGVEDNYLLSTAQTVMFYQGKDEKLDFVYQGKGLVCFADRHVALVSPEEAKTLIWQPQVTATSLAPKKAPTDLVLGNTYKMQQIGRAAMLYLQDNDEKFAFTTASWKEALLPYAKNLNWFYVDSDFKQQFVFNGKLTGWERKPEDLPVMPKIVMFYQGKDEKLDFAYSGRGLVCFADGHVKTVSEDEAKSLIWDPRVNQH